MLYCAWQNFGGGRENESSDFYSADFARIRSDSSIKSKDPDKSVLFCGRLYFCRRRIKGVSLLSYGAETDRKGDLDGSLFGITVWCAKHTAVLFCASYGDGFLLLFLRPGSEDVPFFSISLSAAVSSGAHYVYHLSVAEHHNLSKRQGVLPQRRILQCGVCSSGNRTSCGVSVEEPPEGGILSEGLGGDVHHCDAGVLDTDVISVSGTWN